MNVALVTPGLPRPRDLTVVEGPADVALAAGWRHLPDLLAAEAPRRALLVDSLDDAPAVLAEPVALVATGRALAQALPGRPYVVRPARGDVATQAPAPLTRGDLTGEVVVAPAGVAAVLAAFAAGRTVVAPATPAMRDVVTDGHDGLLVAEDDRRAARDAVARLDADRVLLHLLRHNAWLTAQGWPDAGQQATVLTAVLRRIAHGPPPEPPGALPAAPRPSAARRLRRLIGR